MEMCIAFAERWVFCSVYALQMKWKCEANELQMIFFAQKTKINRRKHPILISTVKRFMCTENHYACMRSFKNFIKLTCGSTLFVVWCFDSRAKLAALPPNGIRFCSKSSTTLMFWLLFVPVERMPSWCILFLLVFDNDESVLCANRFSCSDEKISMLSKSFVFVFVGGGYRIWDIGGIFILCMTTELLLELLVLLKLLFALWLLLVGFEPLCRYWLQISFPSVV